jgi:vitamin B12 transporter
MKKEQKVWAISLIAFGWLAPNLVLSQQDSLRTTQLNEVVITASKFPKSKNDTGKVLTVIDANELNRSVGKDLAQVLNEQVGLVVNGANSSAGKDKSIYLRGAKNDYTLILIDGIPLADPSNVSGGAFDLRLLSLDQVERIEIMKGSQSTLYGSDAIAGVLNIITKTQEQKPISANATLGYGTYNTLQASVGLSGNIKGVNYRVGYSRFNTDGISEAKEAGTNPFDKDGSEQEAFTANVNIEAIKNLSIKPFVRYSEFKGKFDAGAFTDDALNRYEGDLLSVGGLVSYKLKKGSLQGQYTFDETNRLFDGMFGPSNFTGKFQHTEFFGDYQLTQQVQLLGGVSQQHYQMIDKTATEVDPSVTIFSPYATLAGIWNKLNVEAGVRYNHHSRFGNQTTYSINPVYRLRKHKIFANLSSGFKAPSLYQLYGQFGANPDLKPERSRSFEAGISGLIARAKIEWQAVYFNRTIKDVIIYSNFVNINLDEQADHGVELEATVMAAKRLILKTWYSYVTGEVTTLTANGENTFNNLIRRPKHSAGLTISYQVSDKLQVSMLAQAIGKRNDLYFDMTTFTNKSANLKAYTLLDLSAQYQVTRNFSVFGSSRNLLNTTYEEVYGYNTLGTTGTVGLKVNF